MLFQQHTGIELDLKTSIWMTEWLIDMGGKDFQSSPAALCLNKKNELEEHKEEEVKRQESWRLNGIKLIYPG